MINLLIHLNGAFIPGGIRFFKSVSFSAEGLLPNLFKGALYFQNFLQYVFHQKPMYYHYYLMNFVVCFSCEELL